MGSCLATDRIMVEGRRVGYAYREPPDNNIDSGWRFFAGDEDDAYTSDPDNIGIYNCNTVANYDRDIIAILNAPIGSAFYRDEKTGTIRVDPLGSPTD